MELLKGMLDNGLEGNIGLWEDRQEKLVSLIRDIKPKRIMEIGFNMGHSTLLICKTIMELMENDKEYGDIEFYVFDLCFHHTVKPNFQVLKDTFNGVIKLELIEGRSQDTLPIFFQNNDIKFDFIEIDGCHAYTCLEEDILNTHDRISSGGVLYIDDYRSTIVRVRGVDKGVDNFDWINFNTSYIDGVFWGIRK